MTFTEAAVEVLRLVGKPLHYKKITEIAIERNLLSHVGKTPEITMSSRLATMVKKDRGEAPIVKVKPGVFGLRDFDDDVLKAAEKESGHEYELPPEEPDETRRPPEGPATEAEAEAGEAERDTPTPKSTKKLPGQDVFEEEDDDDVPILANLDEPSRGKGGGGGDDEEGGGRRKRRRRRKRGKSGRDDEPGSERQERGERRDRDRDRDRDRGNRRASRRDRVSGDWDREPAEGEVLGHDLADAVRDVLTDGPSRGLSYRRIAELLVKRNKLSGDPGALVPTVAAAVRGDIARRNVAGTMPRFREIDGDVELVEWALPRDAMRAEQDASRAADRQRDLARKAFLRRVQELPMAGLAELLATWLNAEGVVQLRAIRRPSAAGSAFHLAGVLKRGFEETRLAIVVYRDGSDVGREQVIDVRGALHHYDNASAAWLVTTGQVLSGARDESGAPGMAPCGLFDGVELARAMERVGVGLVRHSIPVVSLDLDLLDALGRGQGTPARDRDRDRARDESPRARRGREDEQPEDEDEDTGDKDTSAEDASEDGEASEEGGTGRRRRRRRRRDPDEHEAGSVVDTEAGPDEADVTVEADAESDDRDEGGETEEDENDANGEYEDDHRASYGDDSGEDEDEEESSSSDDEEE